MTPFDLCDLALEEQVDLQLQGIAVSIPLKLIYVGLFERDRKIKVSRDELARKLQSARGTKLSADERDHLPNFVMFTIIDR